MIESLLHTPLHAWHAAHGGRLVDFAGWSMPVQYTSIVEEHQATRRAVAVFDISHMGRLTFHGAQAPQFLDHVLTRRASTLKPGSIRYALVTNDQGGIMDDVLVYHLPIAGSPESEWQLVVNAGNRVKIVEHFKSLSDPFDVQIDDRTEATAMIAVQGPKALAAAQSLFPASLDLASLKYYTGLITELSGAAVVVSRTGYTGEDGVELSVPASAAEEIWSKLVAAGAHPAGLGARDTLRLEAGMPLYGHELSEAIDPFEADLAFAVQLKDHDFVGSKDLTARAAQAPARCRVGLRFSGRRVPREGFAVWHEGEQAGAVTSGTFSPTFEYPIAMAYVTPVASAIETAVEVDVRGRREAAVVTALPFYRRSD